MARVVHFEIHADNPERAVAFYTTVFGWKAEKWPGPMDYYIIKTGEPGTPGIDGGLMLRRGAAPQSGQPVNAYVCTIGIDDIDATLSLALKSGGTLALAKMPVAGVGWLAYVTDTEGNIFGMMQPDPEAQ